MSIGSLDRNLFFLINSGASNPLFDILFPFVTRRGYLLFLPYLFALLWEGYRRRGSGRDPGPREAIIAILVAGCALMVGDWWGNEIKHLVGRSRPQHVLEGVRLLVGSGRAYSFPSNHAVNAFAFGVTLLAMTRGHLTRGFRIFASVIPPLIAFSRVYVGVHYPLDVLAGAGLGSCVGLGAVVLSRRIRASYAISPHATVLGVSLGAVSVFRIFYILHGPVDLSFDEAHYWEWSRRLDLSYYSKGPLIAYLIFLSTSLLGDNVLGVRIPAVLFSVFGSVLLFRLAAILGEATDYGGSTHDRSRWFSQGNPQGLGAALLAQAIPLFAAGGVIFTIDSPFLLLWILSLSLFWKATSREGRMLDWVYVGVAVGLGLLAKYMMLFFFLCGFLFLLFTEKRELLRGPKPYLALLIALLVFSPVILWNAQHDWVTVWHTVGHVGVRKGLQVSPKTLVAFAGSQVGVITPILFFLMIRALVAEWRDVREGSSAAPQSLPGVFLFWFSAPILAFFLVKSAQAGVQANWAAPAYVGALLAFCRRQWGPGFGEGSGFPARKIWIAAGAGLALLTTAAMHFPDLLRLPPKMDPTVRIRGWKDLGSRVTAVYDSMPPESAVFVFSDSYAIASELAFYVKGHPRTYCINLGRRMNQYDLWPDMNQEREAIRTRDGPGRPIHGIFVRAGEAEIPGDVARAFGSWEKRVVWAESRGRVIKEYSLFVCFDFKGLRTERPSFF